MKTTYVYAVASVLAISLLAIGFGSCNGCQVLKQMGGPATQISTMTPMQRVVQANETYTATLRVLNSAREAGVINDEEATKIEAVRVVVADALDQMKLAAESGNDDGFATALRIFNSEIDKLLIARIRAEKTAKQ